MGMLVAGTRESATLNIILVIIKLLALAAFIAFALPAFDFDNLQPFMPYGFGSVASAGENRRVMPAAAILFFSFSGLDQVATSDADTEHPHAHLTLTLPLFILSCPLTLTALAPTLVP